MIIQFHVLAAQQLQNNATINQKSETINQNIFTFDYTYNPTSGMLETYTYPSGFALKYVYNSSGFMSQVRRLDNDNLLWEATEQNQRGQHTDIMFGNGDNISKEFDQYGFPSRYSYYNKAAGGENKANIRNYQFNSTTGNLMSQTDHLSGQWESYTYDQQLHNRLVSWSINGTHTSSIDYSNAGNITRKTDVSSQADSYVYNPWNKPHAVVQIDEPQAGFVAQAMEQTIDYTAFNKAETITQAYYAPSVDRHRLRFTYGTDQQRRKMDYYFVGVNGMEIFRSSTFYLDDFERVIDTDISDIHYLSGPTGLFGILTIEDNTETMHYVHTDYLGSYTYITDADGELAEVLSYDPWGRRRNAYNWTDYNVPSTLFDRGYTGHEHLDQFGLINMNGRVYDPFLARFLSPDPYVTDQEYGQNYNRYSYGLNNPMKYTDPSGEHPLAIVGAALLGGGLNLWSNWDKVAKDPWSGLGYFISGATGGVVSLFNPVLGGTLTASSNMAVDIGFGNMPDFSNPTDALWYFGGLAMDGLSAASAGPTAKWIQNATTNANWLHRAYYNSTKVTYMPSSPGFNAGYVAPEVIVSNTKSISIKPIASSIQTIAKKTITSSLDDVAAKKVTQYSDDLVKAAQKIYPKKAGTTQLHHITPKYLGGAKNGPLVPIDGAYHQLITNEFRALWGYGKGVPSATELQSIMKQVYTKYPLPPGYGF